MEERQIRTGIDRFLDLVNSGKELRISDASKNLGVPEPTLEIWADILHQESLIEIGYDGFGKMVVRPSHVEKPADEKPIKELPSAPPETAEHKMSLKERLSGLKRTKSHKLLKKYSKIRTASDTPNENGIVSKLVTLFKGSFKMHGSGKSGRTAQVRRSVQLKPKTSGFLKTPRLKTAGGIKELRKKTAAPKKKAKS